MAGGRRQIVVATDEAFVVPTATTLRSISTNDAGGVDVTVLCSGVAPESRRRIEASLTHNDVRIRWIDMDAVDLGDTSRSPIGRATFFRLAIGELLPDDIDRVLYLDTDVLVETDLSPLWDLPPSDSVLHAVRSVNYPSICTYGAADHWPELGLNPRAPYFNAGVLMIDLRRWRELDVGRRAFDFLASPLANGKLADQEALNVVLSERWTELDPRWNQQSPFLEDVRGVHLIYDDDVIDEARHNPAVIHFSTKPKPWHTASLHPSTKRWRQIADETSFAPIRLDRDRIIPTLRWRAKRAASILVKG